MPPDANKQGERPKKDVPSRKLGAWHLSPPLRFSFSKVKHKLSAEELIVQTPVPIDPQA